MHGIAVGLAAVEVKTAILADAVSELTPLKTQVATMDERLDTVAERVEKLDFKVDGLDGKIDQVLLKLAEQSSLDSTDPTKLLSSPATKRVLAALVGAGLTAIAQWLAGCF